MDDTRRATPLRKVDRERDARMEIRMKSDEKELIERAAAIGGEDPAQFARRVAIVEARLLIAKVAV